MYDAPNLKELNVPIKPEAEIQPVVEATTKDESKPAPTRKISRFLVSPVVPVAAPVECPIEPESPKKTEPEAQSDDVAQPSAEKAEIVEQETPAAVPENEDKHIQTRASNAQPETDPAVRKESTDTQWSAVSDETTPALNNTPTQQYTPDNTITAGNEVAAE